MKKIINYSLILCLGALFACVDKYYDANPPRLADGPYIFSVAPENKVINHGSKTVFKVNVVDAPAGLDSIAYSVVNEEDEEYGTLTLLTEYKNMKKGIIEIEYEAPSGSPAMVKFTVEVWDLQLNHKGEKVRKTSLPRSADLMVCYELEDIEGTYTNSGRMTRANGVTAEYSYEVTITKNEDGSYQTSKTGHWAPGALADEGEEGFKFTEDCGFFEIPDQALAGVYNNRVSGTGIVKDGKIVFNYVVTSSPDFVYVEEYPLP